MKLRVILLVLIAALGIFPAFAQDGTTNTIQFNGVGFSFDSSLATSVNISQYPGDPTDLQQPGGPDARHTQFNLYTEQPAPESFFDAPVSIRVYRIADISAYEGSMEQVTALQQLLTVRPDLATFMVVTEPGSDQALPFLPVAPASQVIRAHAQYLDTGSLSGVSYITVYRQDVSPFVSNEFFYTFQGVSADGLFYVSARMPLTVSDFPSQIPADFDMDEFAAGFNDYLTESVTTLNAAAPEAFSPALGNLDAIIASITFGGDVPAPGEGDVTEQPTPSDPSLGGLGGVEWQLVSYGSADAPTPVLENAPITAVFSEQGVGGSAGCNTYSGTFEYNQGALTIGQVISTLIACEEAIMAQETAYLAALDAATSYEITDGTLKIFYESGELTFTAPQPSG